MKIVIKQSDNVIFGHGVVVEHRADQIEVSVIFSKEELNRIRAGEPVTILV